MEAKYLELAREIWAEMTPEQRADALKPVDWQAELARMEREALQGLRDELAKMPARSPFDFYEHRIISGLATPEPAASAPELRYNSRRRQFWARKSPAGWGGAIGRLVG